MSSAPVLVCPESYPANTALPVPDASLPDLLISNSGTTAWIALATDAAVGPNAPGCITVPAQGAVMVRSLAANATAATVLAMAHGGALTFQRVVAGVFVQYPCVEVGQ